MAVRSVNKSRETIPIQSFENFLKALFLITKAIKTDEESFQLLYRGQRDSKWDLLPKIARFNPQNNQDFLGKEKRLLEEFKRLSRPYLNPDILKNPWDLLSIAQHHGLPTRLLDWTVNPLVALYFAFRKEDESLTNRAVWILGISKNELADCENQTPFNISKSVAFKPNHITQRLISQNGWFTAHKYVIDTGFVRLNKHRIYKPKLMRIDITNKIREEILSNLNIMGINEFSLFPGLDGLSNYLEWTFKNKQ